MRKRVLPESNYSAIFINGKTIRIPLDPTKPITELNYPEFFDVGINSKCFGGCTAYCYTSALSNGRNWSNLPAKIHEKFGTIDLNLRPFQVALGGSGEPTLHPELEAILKAFKDVNIVPNYTTNGMHLNNKLLNTTLEYCGGVAVTAHPHLEKVWDKALVQYTEAKVKTNVHIVISDIASIELLDRVYKKFNNNIDYFVLLPYMNVGFAANNKKEVDYKALTTWLEDKIKDGKIAFGSNFYKYLQAHPEFGTSLYPPEILSKYLIMEDMKLYNNSFDMHEWQPNE